MSGFDNLGKPVPYETRQRAYEHLKEMVPDVDCGAAMEMIDKACEHIARDEPYAAQRVITGRLPLAIGDVEQVDGEPVAGLALDMTGMYRLMAVLLT